MNEVVWNCNNIMEPVEKSILKPSMPLETPTEAGALIISVIISYDSILGWMRRRERGRKDFCKQVNE